MPCEIKKKKKKEPRLHMYDFTLIYKLSAATSFVPEQKTKAIKNAFFLSYNVHKCSSLTIILRGFFFFLIKCMILNYPS